jgi:hypothetical protein
MTLTKSIGTWEYLGIAIGQIVVYVYVGVHGSTKNNDGKPGHEWPIT